MAGVSEEAAPASAVAWKLVSAVGPAAELELALAEGSAAV
jgi:hypothetical protein